ncbi:MAG: hypothetical protein PVJ57_19175 [Phycisphaerae bacterium]|jgi:hypothetical protein
MPDWLNLDDPIVGTIVIGCAALVVLLILAGIARRLRSAAATARRQAALRRTREHVQMKQQELERLAEHIIATSSTGSIAGFTIIRQIEAVFAEDQRSPAEAVEMLKALAALKGANALINLGSQRLPTGKCVASGDAVIVRAGPAEEETGK